MGSASAVSRRGHVLIICQVYVPDPASVGQHMADAAEELVRRGYDVSVLTANRGYDDPAVEYPTREERCGVRVRRLPWCSFGKSSMIARLVGALSFVVQAAVRGICTPRVDHLLVSTVPPMAPLAALAVSFVRRVRLTFWVMDLNPDQMVVLGKLAPDAPLVRLLEWMNRRILARADAVVVVDRFMAERVKRKRDVTRKLTILAPWPHQADPSNLPRLPNRFRASHGLGEARVVMYSGNHGPSHPLDTLLRAIRKRGNADRLRYVFVGGGVGKRDVEALDSATILSLPYQPFETLCDSLSAADVHVVTMGNSVVGVNHPCKVYGAMAVSRPILLIGPLRSHVGDLLRAHDIGWHVEHGDVDGLVEVLRQVGELPLATLRAMGQRAGEVIADSLDHRRMLGAFCDVVEGSPVPVNESREHQPA